MGHSNRGLLAARVTVRVACYVLVLAACYGVGGVAESATELCGNTTTTGLRWLPDEGQGDGGGMGWHREECGGGRLG